MLDGIDNEPLLINSIAHSAWLLLFAGFLVLFLRDRPKRHTTEGFLPMIAASLGLLWNAGSLVALGASSGLFAGSDVIVALSFTILSLLPATLLQCRENNPSGGGVGLDNVRQRLRLCFGESAGVQIESSDHGSTVSFVVPAATTVQPIPKEVAV